MKGLNGVGIFLVALLAHLVCITSKEIQGKITTEKDIRWANRSTTVQRNVYIYNITNPEDFEKGEKLNCVEIGPYVYRVTKEYDTVFLDENRLVQYERAALYHFDEEASGNLSETDLFNIPNIPLIMLGQMGAVNPPGSRIFQTVYQLLEVFHFLWPEDLHEMDILKKDVSVRELLFDGWRLHNIFVDMGKESDLPDFADGRFGLFEAKNSSTDGKYLALTGKDREGETGKILAWEGNPTLSWWPEETTSDSYCDQIRGSDGSIFPGAIMQTTNLSFFSPEFCRSLPLEFDSWADYRDIPAHKFKIPSHALEDPGRNEKNKCFCREQPGNVTNHCVKGIYRVWPCKAGSPVAISNPRFYDGDESLTDSVIIDPGRKDTHETTFLLDPKTGTVFQSSVRFQLNVEVQPYSFFNYFRDIDISRVTENPSIFLPVVWSEEISSAMY